MSLELTIGANVQPAITAINDMKVNLQKLKAQLQSTTDPSDVNRLSAAIVNQKNQIQQALASTNAFSNSTFGVSRAARIAHSDLDQAARSIELMSHGSEGAVAGLSNLAFTFERLKGSTGSTSSALGALGEALTSPAGILIAGAALLPLLSSLASKFISLAIGEDRAKEELNNLNESLKRSKELLAGYNDDIDKAAVIRKLKIDIETPQGINRTLADFNSDLETAKEKIANTAPAIETYQAELDKLAEKTKAVNKEQEDLHFGSLQFSRNKVFLENAAKQKEALEKQIADAKKELDNAQFEVETVPLKIQLALTDKAREDAKKVGKELKKAVQDGIGEVEFKVPIKPEIESLIKPKDNFKDFVKDLNEGFKAPLIDVPIAPNIQKRIDQIIEAKQEALKLAQSIQGVLTPAFESVFNAIETHQNVFKAFFKSLEQAVAQMISKFLAAAAAAEIVSLILTGGSGGFAGIFSSLIKGGVPHLAKGGIAGGGTLAVVGEAGPEVIMPLDRLKGMLGGLASNNANLNGDFRLSGNDLVLAINRTNRTQGRGG